MKSKDRKLSVYMGEPLRAALAITGDDNPETGVKSRRINNVCERYLDLMHFAMPEFSRGEWCAIMDANNGIGIGGEIMDMLGTWQNVADSADDGLEEKWGIDCQRLAARMRELPRASRIAIGEAVERFWAAHELPTDEALAKAAVKISEP
jgi:hypothetical protein